MWERPVLICPDCTSWKIRTADNDTMPKYHQTIEGYWDELDFNGNIMRRHTSCPGDATSFYCTFCGAYFLKDGTLLREGVV